MTNTERSDVSYVATESTAGINKRGEMASTRGEVPGAWRDRSLWERKWRRRFLVGLTQLVGFAAFIALWEVALHEKWIDAFNYGAPSDIFSTLRKWIGDGTLSHDTLVTLEESGLGFVVAIAGAIPVGLALARIRFLNEVMAPFIDMANATPRFALAPLFVLFFGIGATTKIVLVISVVFFIMLINTIAGASAVNEDYIRLGQVCGASRMELFTRVILPATGGYLIAGFRLSVPYALAGAVVGEMLAGNQGLGYLVANQAGQLDISGVLAAVVALAVLGWLLNKAVTLVVRRTPWVRGDGAVK